MLSGLVGAGKFFCSGEVTRGSERIAFETPTEPLLSNVEADGEVLPAERNSLNTGIEKKLSERRSGSYLPAGSIRTR